jgi:hypothetical protein
MEWKRDIRGVQTLSIGGLHARVWYTGHNTWAAEVDYGFAKYANRNLATVQDARAWCITKLAMLRTADREDGTV